MHGAFLRISTLFLRFVGKRAEIGCFPAPVFLPVFGINLTETVAILPLLHHDRSARIALELELQEPIFPEKHPAAFDGEKLEISLRETSRGFESHPLRQK